MSRVFIGGLPRNVHEREIEDFIRGYGKFKQITVKQGFAFVEFYDFKDADDAVHDLDGKQCAGERVSVEHSKSKAALSGGGNDSRGFSGGGRGYGGAGSSFGGGGGGGRGGKGGNYDRDNYGTGGNNFAIRYSRPHSSKYRMRIENLSSSITWRHLKDMMRKAGDVTYADAHTKQKGIGSVHFASREDLKSATKMYDGKSIAGRTVTCCEENDTSFGSGSQQMRKFSRSRSRSMSNFSRDAKNAYRSNRNARSRSRSFGRAVSRSRSCSRDFKSRSRSR